MVVLDTREDEQLKQQGCAREFITRVQKLRKKAGLEVQDKIHVFFQEADGQSTITAAVKEFAAMVAGALGSVPALLALKPAHSVTIISEEAQFAGSSLSIVVARPAVLFAADAVVAKGAGKVAVEDAKAFVASMDYADVKTALSSSGALSFRVLEETATLKQGEHVFLDAKELAVATKDAELQWLAQA
ncbi:hypothetical protein PINS_up008631 [Pythium insidiosum]|nr:hypothetical protein PINS_up008631 [Pythium insidiosum]